MSITLKLKLEIHATRYFECLSHFFTPSNWGFLDVQEQVDDDSLPQKGCYPSFYPEIVVQPLIVMIPLLFPPI